MKFGKFLTLLLVLSLLPACSQIKTVLPVDTDFAAEDPYTSAVPPSGSYAEYESIGELRYYQNILPAKKWKEVEVLNYSPGYFAFPPLCGYRVLHYESLENQVKVDLFRELIDGDSYMDLMARRESSDHCQFTRSLYRQLEDIDIVEATADCYIWLYGDYLRKYYFVRAGNVVYTFRLLTPPDEYSLAEPDFDFFVSTTIDNYLIYSPRHQDAPYPTQFAKNTPQEKKKSYRFSAKELVSFFQPIAAQNMLSR